MVPEVGAQRESNMVTVNKVKLPRAQAKTVIEEMLAKANGKFVGLENETKKGKRLWSVASRLPAKAVEAIHTPRDYELPPYMLSVYDSGKHAWRLFDTRTAKRAWCGEVEVVFE